MTDTEKNKADPGKSQKSQLAFAAGKLAAETAVDIDLEEGKALKMFREAQQRIPAAFVPNFRDGWDFAVANHNDVNYTSCDDITRERVRRFVAGEPQVEDTAASVQLGQETVSKLMALLESEAGTAMTTDELVSLALEAYKIARKFTHEPDPLRQKTPELTDWEINYKIARGEAL